MISIHKTKLRAVADQRLQNPACLFTLIQDAPDKWQCFSVLKLVRLRFIPDVEATSLRTSSGCQFQPLALKAVSGTRDCLFFGDPIAA